MEVLFCIVILCGETVFALQIVLTFERKVCILIVSRQIFSRLTILQEETAVLWNLLPGRVCLTMMH